MNSLSFWTFIKRQLEQKEPVILLLVLESKGSSPGRQGFKMAVTKQEMIGYIGGGIMEHKFVEMAREKLTETAVESQLKKQFHSKSAASNQSGMICSGEQTIFLYRLNESDRQSIEKLISSISQYHNGTLTITKAGIQFSTVIPSTDINFEMSAEENWTYIEKSGYKNQLHIIGGGHCALALSKIMSGMDFKIHIYEDRKELNTFESNTFVQKKIIVADYANITPHIPSGKNQYVVIMTFGYRTDDIVLRALIDHDFKYIGVLGSKAKMDQLFVEWSNDGISTDRLKNINAPIGIQIKSQTPEEIAVSIAAELIKVKNA